MSQTEAPAGGVIPEGGAVLLTSRWGGESDPRFVALPDDAPLHVQVVSCEKNI